MNIIKEILQNAGLQIQNEGLDPLSELCQDLDLYYIVNADGSIRWAWPKALKEPLFLKFYNIVGFKAIAFAMLTRIVFLFNLQKLVFKSTQIKISKASLEKKLSNSGKWALFTGTIGPNRKGLLYVLSENKGHFLKIAITPQSKLQLDKEEKAISFLNDIDNVLLSYPAMERLSASVLKLSNLSEKAKRSNELTQGHISFLSTICKESYGVSLLQELPIWKASKAVLAGLDQNTDSRIPRGLKLKLQMLLQTVKEVQLVETSFSHGDFTPWNIYVKDSKIAVFDWEYAQSNVPLGFDAFHFIMQQGILVDKKSWRQIQNEIEKQFSNEMFALFSKVNKADRLNYFKYYLLINISRQLEVFSQQEVWHTQIYWLINTWNEALSNILSDFVPQRKLLILDLVDFLMDKPYAALKIGANPPESLSEFSDMDICCPKSTYLDLSNFLKKHILVQRCPNIYRSFMGQIQAVCHDGGILSLDLIWKIKRKATLMLSMEQVLENHRQNQYGLKVASAIDNARFVGLFYALNQADVIETYQPLALELEASSSKLDQSIYQWYQQEKESLLLIKKQLKGNRENRALRGFLNQFHYLIDCIRSFYQGSGMVITFSGVDGAGKSTVIENVVHRIEKQLRKKVVVLRHRPSLLPILSAWTKGKKAAEAASVARLPRQGENKNLLSSVLRFSYYFLDYLLGQFYIHIKYVWRGYVVVYDRYYFDFISDGRRSNVDLPKFIPRMGYNFLFKPNLNFFLYAQPATILSRKRELDSCTIVSLTQEYRSLFKELEGAKKGDNEKYIGIENEDLENTLQLILKKIIQKSA